MKVSSARIRKSSDFRKVEIADMAMRIIAQHGMRKFTAKAIANEIGITDAAVFRHFPTMEAIIETILQRMEDLLFKNFPPIHDDPIQRLGLFFQSRVVSMSEHPHLSRLLLSEELSHLGDEASFERLQSFKHRSQKFVLSCLREAECRGALNANLRPETAAVLVLGAVLALGHANTPLRHPALALAKDVWVALEGVLSNREKAPRKISIRKPQIPKRLSTKRRPS